MAESKTTVTTAIPSTSSSDQPEEDEPNRKAFKLNVPVEIIEKILKLVDIKTFFAASEVSLEWMLASDRFVNKHLFWKTLCKNELTEEFIETVRRYYYKPLDDPSWYTIAKAYYRWKVIGSGKIKSSVETIPIRNRTSVNSDTKLTITVLTDHYILYYGDDTKPLHIGFTKNFYLNKGGPRVPFKLEGNPNEHLVTVSNTAFNPKSTKIYFFCSGDKLSCMFFFPGKTIEYLGTLYLPGTVDILNFWNNEIYTLTNTGVLCKFIKFKFERLLVRDITHIPQDEIIKRYAFGNQKFAYLSNKSVLYLCCSKKYNALSYDIYRLFNVTVTAVLVHGTVVFLGYENGMVTAHYAEPIEDLKFDPENCYINKNITEDPIERLDCFEEDNALLLVVISSSTAKVIYFEK